MVEQHCQSAAILASVSAVIAILNMMMMKMMKMMVVCQMTARQHPTRRMENSVNAGIVNFLVTLGHLLCLQAKIIQK
jgi:3-hydroxy-3-methylglutaryl CoA synthase